MFSYFNYFSIIQFTVYAIDPPAALSYTTKFIQS